MNSKPIGVFDSGIGGLTVVKKIMEVLPRESIVYLGDTARVPYGPRGRDVVKKFALELLEFILKKDIKFLVVACNTVSSVCLEEVKQASSVPVLGVVGPAVGESVKKTRNKKISVIGTRATIGSRIYERKIKKLDPKIEVLSKACPLFVPLAEEGLLDHPATETLAQEYLKDIIDFGADTLVLACTHYPLLKKVIQKVVGEKVFIVDSAEPTAAQLTVELKQQRLLNLGAETSRSFFVTDETERVNNVSESFLGRKLPGRLNKISL